MAPVVPAPCWASRHLMPGVPSQPVRRPRTPPVVRRPPRRARRPKAVAAPPSRAPRRRPVRSPPPADTTRRLQQPLLLRRTSSEPVLPSWSEDDELPGDSTALPRFSTCSDVCSPGLILALSPLPWSTSPSPPKSQEGAAAAAGGKGGRYTDESKVVVNVTVEGCPGPVRALVRLGATVEETIAIVAEIYRKEGRRPRLDDDAGDGRGEGSLRLYHSYFCLQGLNKSDRLGELGGRSFYLRRCSTDTDTASSGQSAAAGDIVPDGRFGPQTALLGGAHSCLIVSFLVKRLGKIARRGRKIWNMLGCIASD